jgi:hypothetical protein
MTDYTTPAEHTFLTPAEVFDRYRWKRTTGYEQVRSAGFPPRQEPAAQSPPAEQHVGPASDRWRASQ